MGALLLSIAASAGSSLLPVWMVPKLAGEINSNLMGYYLLLQMVGVGVAVAFRRALGGRFAALLAGLLLALTLYDVQALHKFIMPAPVVDHVAGPRVVFFSADLEGAPQQLSMIAQEALRRKEAVVVGLSGVTAEIVALLSQEFPSFAVIAAEPRADGFGLALLTRGVQAELTNRSVGEAFEELPPVLSAQLTYLAWPPIDLALFRLPVPITRQARQVGDLVTRRVFVPFRNQRSSFVALGNFNLTPTSNTYRRALWATKGRNAMEGFGYQRSCCFPSPWLRFPVNHVLYGGALAAVDFGVLPSEGGRIAPVVATLQLERQADATAFK